ncbi:uncharacterized protein BXZ73DRAFT_88379 [Epithele typhae]|uniref:uncharacterized protein n=1 Tax=Epithele typhae TaxID=378194 RepID=UPI002007C472|nr:uncharacterized protein BXZ73DRAFT_88379 [Epithele typhae]KAH9941213.1 hypothetical protein BXZ73DRAFT_88379 [Epithele typhae]
MIGTSFPEYVFIRLAILSLRSIAPLSFLYLGASAYYRKPAWSNAFGWALGAYACVEAGFYLFVFLPRKRLVQKAAAHPPLPLREEREALFERCFASMRNAEVTAGWFPQGTLDTLKRDNLIEWLLWAFFGAPQIGMQDEWEEEIDGYVQKLEDKFGFKLEHGWNEKAKCLKLTLDPVDAIHRPLLWYLIIGLVDNYTGAVLTFSGLRHYNPRKWTTYFPLRSFTLFSKRSAHPDMVYWYRPHRSATKDPILFIHGIGIGLWPYIPFLRDLLASDPDVGIIAIETLAISSRISPPPLTHTEVLSAIRSVLDAHDFKRVVVAGHSYGTVIAAWMLRDPMISPRVSAWLLADPIPFLLHCPAIAYNFVYRQPRRANEWLLWYFSSRDLDIARALARHFFWAENVLWKEELEGRRVAVSLSGRDQIVDAPEVWQYLTGELEGPSELRWKDKDLEVLYFDGLDHAEVFDTKRDRRIVLGVLTDFL